MQVMSVLSGASLPLILLISTGVGWLLAGPVSRTPVHSMAERLLLYWIIGMIALSWVGTILAGFGLFYWWFIVAVIGLLAVCLRARISAKETRETGLVRATTPTPKPVVLTLVLVLVGAGWLYDRPSESLFVVDDPSAYTVSGVLLARSGSLFHEPDVFWRTTGEFVRQFFQLSATLQPTRHWMPFYQWTEANPTIELGFLPLPKVWIALSTWLFGIEKAAATTPFMALAGLASLYALVRRSTGWLSGLAALVLLGVSLPQVWFGRHPTSEIIAQAMVLGGLYLATVARQNVAEPRLARHLSAWSALAFATLSVLRFEGPLILIVLAFFMVTIWSREDQACTRLLPTWGFVLTVAAGYGLLISVTVARHYMATSSLLVLTPGSAPLLLLACFAVGAIGLSVWRLAHTDPERARRLAGKATTAAPWITMALCLLWLALAVYYALLADSAATIVGWMGQYLTTPGVLIAGLGAAWIPWCYRRGRHAPELVVLVGTGAVFALLFSVNHYVTPVHPWAVRRLLPVVLPAFATGTAVLLTTLPIHWLPSAGAAPASRALAKAIPGVSLIVLLALAVSLGRLSGSIAAHREMDGFWGQLEEAVAVLPDNALLLFDNGTVAKGLTQPLEFLLGHPSVAFAQVGVDSDSAADALLDEAFAQDRAAYFVVTNGNLGWWPQRWSLAHEGAKFIEYPTLRQPYGRLPTAADIVQRRIWLDFYRIKSAEEWRSSTSSRGELHVAGGPGSYPYLREGFYGWESGAGDEIARWTDGGGLIMLPWPAPVAAQPVSFVLALRVSGGRAAEAEVCQLTVQAEDADLASTTLPNDFEPQTLILRGESIVNSGRPQLEIRLKSNTWDGAAVGDPRDLGVLFYSLSLIPE